ncbi:oxysterol binding protein [Mucor lusitanicus]
MPHHITDNESNTEELAEGSRSILLNIASQLTKGMDLHRVTLPTFVLEPRSMLERITDFMAHPEFILPISDIDDDTQRFIAVVKWFLSGWHIKPKGVKKPFNPVLGEFFRCRYNYQDGTEAFYIAEQVSHHPPASAYFYTCPQHQVVITGDLKPKSRFYGNSVASLMQGTINFILPSRHNELYQVKMPNMYARGVLFGTMTLELGDASTVRCVSSDLICEMDFQTKGFFSGQPNSVVGKIKRESTQEILYEISGQWSGELFIKKYTPPEKSSIGGLLSLTKKSTKEDEKPDLMVDVRDYVKYPLQVPEHQEEKESRRLWAKLTEGLMANNQDMATDEKTKVEDEERALRKDREAKNIEWKPRFFDVDGDDYKFKGLDKLDFKNPQAICQELSTLFQ